MQGFVIKSNEQQAIRFIYYTSEAPVTVAAFDKMLPFAKTLLHARVSGQEVWTDDAPALDIIQENASVFTVPGEVVLGPLKPARAKTAKCLGIYYGEGRGLDCCNIFARVVDEDFHLLEELGESIWKYGARKLTFEHYLDEG